MSDGWFSTLIDSVKGVAPTIIGTAVNTVVPGAGGIASDLVGGIMRDITGDKEVSGDAQKDLDRMAQAIMADPEKTLEFTKAMGAKEVELAKIQAQTEQHYESETTTRMDNEGKSEHWPQWSWRPWNGFLYPVAIILVFFVLPLCGKIVPTNAYPVFLLWGGVLGVSAHHRGKGKREAAGTVDNGLMGGIINKLLK